MRHIADGRLRQKTPDACGNTRREMNVAPVAFSMIQNAVVCLPLLSESQKLIWVHSNQVDIQLDGAAELDEAFDRFPYLTQKQTAALARRCSLHPDQVKVWFMVQRLRYGISWDHKDIRELRRKFKSSQRKEQRKQDRMGEVVKEKKREKKRQVKESDGKKAGKEQSANEGRMMGASVGADERLERKMEQEQPLNKEQDRKVEKIEKDKRNPQKRKKKMTLPDKIGRKRMKQDIDGIMKRAGAAEIRGDQAEREGQKSIQSETSPTRQMREKLNNLMSVIEWPADKSFVVPDEPLDVSPLLLSDNLTEVLQGVDVVPPIPPNIGMTPVSSGFEGKPEMEGEVPADNDGFVTDVCKMKELLSRNPVADSSSTLDLQQDSDVIDACGPIPCNTKSETQLKMMKVAFSCCQYPKSEDYDRLATLIGIPRYTLVKWFGDMRYYIKKVKPSWLNKEQHKQALANIRYWQCVNTLTKTQSSTGCGKATRKRKPLRESPGEDESVEMMSQPLHPISY
ncbi:homeobox and leucine zipper encoding b [Trachinotus anak]|uniref:homeobox and leucine zipper encoding b n=1 Tax=Trachinotus anak TaxID=443729 RepID=UPI0039F1DC0D